LGGFLVTVEKLHLKLEFVQLVDRSTVFLVLVGVDQIVAKFPSDLEVDPVF